MQEVEQRMEQLPRGELKTNYFPPIIFVFRNKEKSILQKRIV